MLKTMKYIAILFVIVMTAIIIRSMLLYDYTIVETPKLIRYVFEKTFRSDNPIINVKSIYIGNANIPIYKIFDFNDYNDNPDEYFYNKHDNLYYCYIPNDLANSNGNMAIFFNIELYNGFDKFTVLQSDIVQDISTVLFTIDGNRHFWNNGIYSSRHYQIFLLNQKNNQAMNVINFNEIYNYYFISGKSSEIINIIFIEDEIDYQRYWNDYQKNN